MRANFFLTSFIQNMNRTLIFCHYNFSFVGLHVWWLWKLDPSGHWEVHNQDTHGVCLVRAHFFANGHMFWLCPQMAEVLRSLCGASLTGPNQAHKDSSLWLNSTRKIPLLQISPSPFTEFTKHDIRVTASILTHSTLNERLFFFFLNIPLFSTGWN